MGREADSVAKENEVSVNASDFYPLAYALVSAVGAYAAVRVEIRHLWRKLTEHDAELVRLRTKLER